MGTNKLDPDVNFTFAHNSLYKTPYDSSYQLIPQTCSSLCTHVKGDSVLANFITGDFIVKQKILWIHRYLGLCLMPIFMLILITGGLLALKPILAPNQGTGFSTELSSEQILQALKKIDPKNKITNMTVLADGQSILINGKNDLNGIYNLHTGERTGNVGMNTAWFNTIKNLHKALLIDADLLIKIATYAMALILLVAPFLLKPHLKATLIDSHNLVGWCFYPLLLLLPVTGILMTLHLGAPQFEKLNQSSNLSAYTTIEKINKMDSLNHFVSLNKIKNRYQTITLNKNGVITNYQIDENNQLQPIQFSRFWVKELHEGTWGGSFSGWLNLFITIILLALTGTGFYSWLRRFRQSHQKEIIADARILIAFASQTGTAAQLAKNTAAALRATGEKVACNPMSTLLPPELIHFDTILFFISTTGEGDIPEQGKKLIDQLPHIDLSQVKVAVFALGDKNYTHFCQAGKILHSNLDTAGAQFLLPTEYIDGAPNTPWQLWLQQIANQMNIRLGSVKSITKDIPCSLLLTQKFRLDSPEANLRETWCLQFKPQHTLPFRPGDLLLITPDLDNKARVYSIGSSHLTQDYLELTIGLENYQQEDGNIGFGICSGYLCHRLEIDTMITAQLRPNPDFHPPESTNQKIILIAAGTGIAPYSGFINERAQNDIRATWLFYGCGKKTGDFLYGTRFEHWSDQGCLKLTTAFAFDDDDGHFIQDKMIQHATTIFDWITQEHAIIYVCGRASTVGKGTRDALITIYKINTKDSDHAAETWVADLLKTQQLRMDLFG